MSSSNFNKKGAIGFGVDIPFVTHMGFELELFEGGESAISYTPRPEHLNTFHVVHGGACLTLLDVTMALAARSLQKDMGAVTIEMKTSFMRPTPGDGSAVMAKGRVMHRTATMVFTEGTIYDSQGKACAHATGTFKYVKRLPVTAASGSAAGVISTD